MTWRNLALGLGLFSLILGYRDCTRVVPQGTSACSESPSTRRSREPSRDDRNSRDSRDEPSRAAHTATATVADMPGVPSFNNIKLPTWTAAFAPMPGETLHDYKERMLPLVETALAPQRDRVAAARDQFVAAAHLDESQRAALDHATQDAATEIENTVISSALAGDFSPSTFKPMTGVAAARHLLDVVERANSQFLATLTADQRQQLAQQPFDFGDYLLFGTRWEDALPF